MQSRTKIVVLDDDPTGSQTVHSCLLLLSADTETLLMGLRDEAPILFVLTNTRAMDATRAAQVTQVVCHNLKQALAMAGINDFLVVSRSDSTLRGHFPVETDVIAAEMGPIDALFLVPAFLEAGRITRDSVHYLVTDGVEVPVHETEFAQDSVFGYAHSYLPEYVAEKTRGRIPADKVERLVLADIRAGVLERLLKLTANQCVVVDAETQDDLNRFGRDLLTAVSRGKRFLLRSAASVLTSLAGLPPQAVPSEAMARYVRNDKPGAVIVGSHVQITTEQLEQLLTESTVAPIEVKVGYLLESAEGHAVLLKETVARAREAHSQGKTPVVFTPREEISFEDIQTRLVFGEGVSALLMDIVRGLPGDIGFLIAKGGITSNDVLSTGLELASARLLGQILPGVSMVCTGEEHPQFPNLPVVLFPGNVGDADALRTVYRRLASR